MAGRVERGVDNLQRLYTIVIGIALTEALARFVLGPGFRTSAVAAPATLYLAAYVPTMVAFVATLLPFYHGALRYLDETYVINATRVKPSALLVDFLVLFVEANRTRKSTKRADGLTRVKPSALLVDFLVLFVEAKIFYWMALTLNDWRSFFQVMLILLVVDTVWIAFTFFYSGTFLQVWKWGVINVASLVAVWVVLYTPLIIEEKKQTGLVALALIRTAIDYVWNWTFFHPTDGVVEAR